MITDKAFSKPISEYNSKQQAQDKNSTSQTKKEKTLEKFVSQDGKPLSKANSPEKQ